jgi:hypothetical protein
MYNTFRVRVNLAKRCSNFLWDLAIIPTLYKRVITYTLFFFHLTAFMAGAHSLKRKERGTIQSEDSQAPRRSTRDRRANIQLQIVSEKVTHHPRPPKSTVDIPMDASNDPPNPLAPVTKTKKHKKKKAKVSRIVLPALTLITNTT